MRTILQVVYVEKKTCYSGSRAVRLATNHCVGYKQDGHTDILHPWRVKLEICLSRLSCGHSYRLSWCRLFLNSVLQKSIEFSFHTFIKSWCIDIRNLFLAKRYSHKVKSKFSRWTNFPEHKSGPKKRVGPHGGPQPPRSHPPPTRDAAHGKHAGSEGDRREQELYKEKSCVVDIYRRMAG